MQDREEKATASPRHDRLMGYGNEGQLSLWGPVLESGGFPVLVPMRTKTGRCSGRWMPGHLQNTAVVPLSKDQNPKMPQYLILGCTPPSPMGSELPKGIMQSRKAADVRENREIPVIYTQEGSLLS